MFITHPVILYFIILLVISPINCQQKYCSSYCGHSTNDCSIISYILSISCDRCAPSVFLSTPSSGGVCQLKTSTSLYLYALQVNAMSLVNFQTSNSSTYTCGVYQISGRYIDKDYISTNLTLTNNHYQIVIRFSVAYIGTWSINQYLNLYLKHQYNQSNNSWHYSCAITQFLCSTTGLDCFQNKEFIIPHNTSYLFLNFTALYNQSDPLDQNWGIKDLLIFSRTCHSNCISCYGPTENQCIKCAASFYLLGNTCNLLAFCPNFYIVSQKLCVTTCPIRYYYILPSKQCKPCTINCIICTSAAVCLKWQQLNDQSNKIWKDYISIWAALIGLAIILLAAIIWALVKYCCLQSYIAERAQNIRVNQELTHTYDQNDLQNLQKSKQIFQNIDQLNQSSKRVKRKSRRTIAGIQAFMKS